MDGVCRIVFLMCCYRVPTGVTCSPCVVMESALLSVLLMCCYRVPTAAAGKAAETDPGQRTGRV
jgi:hypothetical protein